jgi:hypothetical protein
MPKKPKSIFLFFYYGFNKGSFAPYSSSIKYLKSYHFDKCIKLNVNYLALYYVKSNNWCLYYLRYGYHIRNFFGNFHSYYEILNARFDF